MIVDVHMAELSLQLGDLFSNQSDCLLIVAIDRDKGVAEIDLQLL